MAAEGQKSTHFRVAFAVACGLALCCAVMYVTADGADEADMVKAEWKYHNIIPKVHRSAMAKTSELGAVKGLRSANIAKATASGHEIKIESWDVKKAGRILTDDTPDGRMRLIKYFYKVERQIAHEVAGRKADIAAIRTQMAKNMAYNKKARDAMRKDLLARMAVNAKRAKDALDAQMRWTARTFAHQAAVANRRNKATLARSRKTREIMRKNKRANQHQLHMAVLNQQRALSALDSATNAKIRQTNKHIAANAAQIKINARKARKDLEHAMNRFDKNMNQVTAEAKAGRNKLARQSAAMNKRVRAMVGNKIRGIAAWSAAQFRGVRAQMAKDRHHADMMLSQASARMTAALNANAALQNKRFAKTVSDINKAKAESDARIAAAKKEFKMNLLNLGATVKHQVGKLNSRVTQLQGVITKNRLEQARVNKNVSAEMKRMIKMGNHREEVLAKKNAALHSIISKNKAEVEKRMQMMAKNFYLQISKIRAQAKKDRNYQERRLSKTTGKLFAVLAKNAQAQAAANKKLTEASRRARLDADQALREAKHGFANRLGALHSTVVKNDKKVSAKIQKLTKVEEAEAIKSAKGRRMLKMQSQANKLELKSAIREAVNKGEQRAKKIEKMAKKMNKKTRDALSARVSTEIGTLTKSIHSDIEDLQLATKSARAQMRRQILYAVRSAAALAKRNLKKVVTWANKRFLGLNKRLSATNKKNAAARAALASEVAANKKQAARALRDAVGAQARALLALKEETSKKIKKTNTRVDAYGRAVEKHAREVAAQMKSNVDALEKKVNAARSANVRQLKGANKASAARHAAALKFISSSLQRARKDNDKKFGEAYAKMGKNRATQDRALARAVGGFNDALAKRSALEDARFRKTVKNISWGKELAWKQATAARKKFTMDIYGLTAAVKNQESRLTGEIAVVSAMVISNKAAQIRVNKRTKAEMDRVIRLADRRFSSSKRARGKLKELFNKNKIVAAQEIKDLRKSSDAKLKKLRAFMAQLRREAAKDLTSSTKKMYQRMAAQQAEQLNNHEKLSQSLRMAKVSTAAAVKSAKAEFASRFNTLVNTVTSNDKKYEKGLKHITGVAHDWKSKSAADRRNLQTEIKGMGADLNKAIGRAVQLGEAKAKAVLDRANEHMSAMRKALQLEIAERVERMADQVFKGVQQNRATIANNYLSVKGYAGSAKNSIVTFIQRGRGKALSSVGDFLQTVAFSAVIRTKAAEGVGAGAAKLNPAFGGGIIPAVKELSKVNGLVNEYMRILTAVRMRWRMGLGKYLLGRLAEAMQKKGILAVGKKSGASGQFVYVSGHALGLSSQVDSFSQLGSRLAAYQGFLAKLSAKLPKKSIMKPMSIPPPEWQGN
jgi:hypothetical protein